MHCILQHGWGFMAECWQGWPERLSGSCLLAERGYWGQALAPDAGPQSSGAVLICHSLGLHLLPPALIRQARLLVVLSSFLHFHGQTPAEGRFSRRHLERMHCRLAAEPLALVQDFHRDCDCPGLPLPGRPMDVDLLRDDLILLDQSRLAWTDTPLLPPVLILHGACDRIVPPARAEELAAALPGSLLTIIPQAGHGLPFTHPDICLEHILRLLT